MNCNKDYSELDEKNRAYIDGMRIVKDPMLQYAADTYIEDMNEPGMETHNKLLEERVLDVIQYIKNYIDTEICEMIVSMVEVQATHTKERKHDKGIKGTSRLD